MNNVLPKAWWLKVHIPFALRFDDEPRRVVVIIRDHSFHKLRNAKNGINNLYVACSSSVFVAADLSTDAFII